jgi:hypothetical protein
MPKKYRMKAKPGRYAVTAGDVEFRHSVTITVVKKNWPLMAVYAMVTIAGLVGSYFVTGWLSVALSTFVAVVTFGVGYYMLQQVVTTTHRLR